MPDTDLDAAFLDFIRAPDPDARRRIHGWYVDLFDGRRRVVDLACGEGEFVGFLTEAGFSALGVDSDRTNVAVATAAGRNVVQGEVLGWLAAQPDESVDGFFNAHLVEHLPYGAVAELYRECRRILVPGGLVVTVTPNVRALYSHLETYYQHFGHVTFYHPRLLAFFAHCAGFERSEEGENPQLAAPMFGRPASDGVRPSEPLRGWDEAGRDPSLAGPLRYGPELPRRGGAIGSAWWRLKMAAVTLLVRPYLDPLVEDLRRAMSTADAELDRLDRRLTEAAAEIRRTDATLDEIVARIDRSYEAYVISSKAGKNGIAKDSADAGSRVDPQREQEQ